MTIWSILKVVAPLLAYPNGTLDVLRYSCGPNITLKCCFLLRLPHATFRVDDVSSFWRKGFHRCLHQAHMNFADMKFLISLQLLEFVASVRTLMNMRCRAPPYDVRYVTIVSSISISLIVVLLCSWQSQFSPWIVDKFVHACIH